MESEFFLNAGIPPHPPLQHFDQAPSSTVPTWPPLPSTMQGSDCFISSWEKSTDQGLQFDSALSSMVSSPVASNSNVPNECFMIRELIGKLGNIGGEISPHSCYSTPLNSPPKVNNNNHLHEGLIFPEFTADPEFAERAARFSCFGSRSFNERTNQVSVNNADLAAGYRGGGGPVMGNVKLSRVSSSPSLKAGGAHKGNRSLENSSSQEESTVSEQVQKAVGLKELNSRKRKASSKGKGKDPPATNHVKEAETNSNSDTKRSKPNEGNGSEIPPVKAEEYSKRGSEEDEEKQNKANSNLPEPPKDYIHVRARRGQATDSHSLAERVRREKISERMKLLQDLVPGCNKVTGKALMLDEIINYVQSLQRQVEFLSMKLASVDTRMDIDMETPPSKDMFQSNHQLPYPMFPLDSSASAIFGHRPLQNPGLHTDVSNVDPLDSDLHQNPNLLDGFHPTAQFSAFCEGDLQSIVQMGFGQNPSVETLQSQDFQGSNQLSNMKVEL